MPLMQTRPGLPPPSNSHALASPPVPPELPVVVAPVEPPVPEEVVPLLVSGPPTLEAVAVVVVLDVVPCVVALVVAPCVVLAAWVPEGPTLAEPVVDAVFEALDVSSEEEPLHAAAETQSIDRAAETWNRMAVA